jgi:GAF domain-containing protein
VAPVAVVPGGVSAVHVVTVGSDEPAADVARCALLSDPARVRSLAESGLTAVADTQMEALAERVRRWVGAPVALVSLVQPDRQVFPGMAGLPEPWASTRSTPLTHSFCQYVVASAEPLVVADAREHPLLRDNHAVHELGVVAYAGMPLTDESGNVLGSLCAIDVVPREWSDDQLRALRDLADACSTELRLRLVRYEAQVERTRRDQLEDELRRAAERARTLLIASEAFTDTETVEDVRTRAAELVDSELAPSYAELVLPDDPEPPFTAVVAEAERRLVTYPDRLRFDADHPQPDRVWLRERDLHAVVAAPLLHDDGPLGTLLLGWDAPHPLEPSDQLTVTTLAGFAAQALDRALRLQYRTGVAHQLQQAMLTSLPAVPGLEMAASYHPADSREHVGGDWYDAAFIPDPQRPDDEVIAVCVGDVVGHTLQAATLMGQVRAMLRQAAWDHPGQPPSHALTALELATTGLGVPATGTAVLAHLRRTAAAQWSMTWSNAGHPPPVLLCPDRSTVLLEGHDILFGYPRFRSGPRCDHHHVLDAGSTLFLYTDGLVERRDSDVDEGIDRLRVLLAELHGRSPAEMVDTAVEALAPDARDDVVAFAIHLSQA